MGWHSLSAGGILDWPQMGATRWLWTCHITWIAINVKLMLS